MWYKNKDTFSFCPLLRFIFFHTLYLYPQVMESKILSSALSVFVVSAVIIISAVSGSSFLSNRFEWMPIVNAVGPESFAFDPITSEGPYTGVSDGRIVKWNQTQRRWTNFSVTTRNRCTNFSLQLNLSKSNYKFFKIFPYLENRYQIYILNFLLRNIIT